MRRPAALSKLSVWMMAVFVCANGGCERPAPPDRAANSRVSAGGDPAALLDTFRRAGLTISATATRHLINETLTIYRMSAA